MLKHNCEHYVGAACPMCAKEDSELIAKLQSQLRDAVAGIEKALTYSMESNASIVLEETLKKLKGGGDGRI